MKEKLINTRSMRYRVLIGSPDCSVIVLRSDWPTRGHVTIQRTNQHRDNEEPFIRPISVEQDNREPFSRPISVEQSITWSLISQSASSRVITWSLISQSASSLIIAWSHVSQSASSKAMRWYSVSQSASSKVITWFLAIQSVCSEMTARGRCRKSLTRCCFILPNYLRLVCRVQHYLIFMCR